MPGYALLAPTRDAQQIRPAMKVPLANGFLLDVDAPTLRATERMGKRDGTHGNDHTRLPSE
jgi:hypothetical protein